LFSQESLTKEISFSKGMWTKNAIKEGLKVIYGYYTIMKRILILTMILFILLFSSLAEAQVPIPPDVPTLGPELIMISGDKGANVKITSPISQVNYVGEIKLNIIVEAIGMLGQFGNVGYSLDGGTIYSIKNLAKSVDEKAGYQEFWWKTTAGASLSLPNLSDGFHNITVYYGWQYQYLQPYLEVHAYTTVVFSIGNVQATPEIYINSPSNQSLINNKSPILNIDLRQIQTKATSARIYYSIDGKNHTIINIEKTGIGDIINKVTSFNQMIANLSDGLHYLTVYSQVYYFDNWLFEGNSSIQFIVDTSPPSITELSIANKTYSNQDVSLNFNLNEHFSWIGYNLDSQGNVTMTGNTTLTGLSFGSHNLVVYANDTLGNMGKSETASFTIKEPDGLPTNLVIIGVVTIALTSIGLLIYLKKQKR
jgi:hypothetical protein